jgi:L-lactate dehydrogenase
MKVGIVGMGWVGTSVAISILHKGIVTALLLNDARADLAEGEAMDLRHGSAFYPHASVGTAAVEDMADADAVVIAAGRGGRPGESRLELLRENAAVIRSIASQLSRFRGLLIIVTNPVDILTQLALEYSGLPPDRVLGTGTMLDTARLRQVIGRELSVDPRSVHAQVIGEHGDSKVALWSSARVGGKSLREWNNWRRAREPQLDEEVRLAAHEIIRRKGATNHAIGLVTAALLSCALRDERRVLTVSRLQLNACGVSELALSLPAVVSAEGATQLVEPDMDEAERESLLASAEILRKARAQAGV